ncbi:hypothetical protein AADZ90_017375 [Aestuariibius sp. 2305UL40-4]|uniref:hypothetical protein n=1 Tax=Aestuariibius violaceus TaxID=3234132 RepID=UPI00345E1233
MSHLRPFAAIALLLAGCTEQGQPQTPQAGGTTVLLGPEVTSINYPLSALPLSNPIRLELTFELAALASPEVQRACTAQEIEFTELSVILLAVRSEEWRTSPWTNRQRREVERLQQRWETLGGDAQTISDRCRSVIAA